MKKQIEIVVPQDYSAITLEKYLQIQKDLKNNEDDIEIQKAFLLYNFCGITPEIAVKLDKDTVDSITHDLYKLLNKQEYELQRFITIGDVQYGFEPNLSKMSYGSYLDITDFETVTIDENWSTIMSILYRPVTKKLGALYEIEPYKGYSKKDTDKWLEVSMDFHFGVFFYFIGLYKDLVSGILNYTKNLPEISPNIKLVLEKSGELIQQLYNSPVKTS